MKKSTLKNELYFCGEEIVRRLEEAGFKAYFAGGFARDLFTGRRIKDIDIATSALPEDVESIFKSTFETGKAFGIINVLIKGFRFEVATFREERGYSDGRHPDHISYTKNPEIDSSRRDFTINSMFYSPLDEEILDFQGGIDDISKGILRTVGNPMERFSQDHLRILRAIRFAAEYGFEIENETATAIRNYAHLLSNISVERIREELEKILKGFDPSSAFSLLEQFGILEIILPELSAMKGVHQDPEYHPEGDVMTHTKLMLSHFVEPSSELVWSALLHDCGKPNSFSLDSDGRCRFYGHEEEGSLITSRIMSRFKFSHKTQSSVVSFVRNHMRMASALAMRKAKLSRLICAENFPDELELHRIDCVSSHKKMDSYLYLLDKYAEFAKTPQIPKPLVTGKDLISIGLQPGPSFSKILSKLHDKQIENPNICKDDLLKTIGETEQ